MHTERLISKEKYKLIERYERKKSPSKAIRKINDRIKKYKNHINNLNKKMEALKAKLQ